MHGTEVRVISLFVPPAAPLSSHSELRPWSVHDVAVLEPANEIILLGLKPRVEDYPDLILPDSSRDVCGSWDVGRL